MQLTPLRDDQMEIIKDLKADVKFRYLEYIMKEYFRDSLKELVSEIRKIEQENKPLLTIEDVARMFSVTKATVHNWKNKGIIVGKKLGKNRYFTEEEVRNSITKFGISKQWDVN